MLGELILYYLRVTGTEHTLPARIWGRVAELKTRKRSKELKELKDATTTALCGHLSRYRGSQPLTPASASELQTHKELKDLPPRRSAATYRGSQPLTPA